MSIPYLYPDNKIIIVGQYPMDAAHIHGGVEASVYGLAQELAKKFNVSVFDVPRSDVPDRVEMDGNAEVRRFNRKLK